MFQRTISALCYEIGEWHSAGTVRGGLQAPYNDVAEFVAAQWAAMPDFLRLPLRAATVFFAWSAVFRRGRFYHQLDPAQRRLQRLAWRSSRVGAFRDLMRFYESLATVALHSRPYARELAKEESHAR